MPYLQLRAGFWRVRMPIPKHLQAIIGRGSRLTRALHTADREEADRLSLPVVAEFMDIIAAAEAKANWSTLMAEAAERAAKIAKFPWFRLNAPEAILRGLMNPETGEWLKATHPIFLAHQRPPQSVPRRSRCRTSSRYGSANANHPLGPKSPIEARSIGWWISSVMTMLERSPTAT